MSHPHTRAERRAHRVRVIHNRLHAACDTLRWFRDNCTCWPTGYSYDHVPLCDLHDDLNPRRVAKFSKQKPYQWIRRAEPDYYARGVLRKDYRAGGGRRSSSSGIDWGGGVHEAGRFSLSRSLADEWEREPCFPLTTDEDLDDLEEWWPETTQPSVRPEDRVRARKKRRYLRRTEKRQKMRAWSRRWNEATRENKPLTWETISSLLRQHESPDSTGQTREGLSGQ